MDQRPRDQQAPPHAAGELVDPRIAAIGEDRHLERALDRRAPVGAADPVEVGEHEQVLLDRQSRVEIVELRRDAALGARHLRLLRQAEAEHLELALVRDRLRGQEAHGGRLAGAVRSEQADAGPHRDLEVEVVDRCDRPVALDDPAQADGELRLHPSSMPAGAHPAAWRGERSRSQTGDGSTRHGCARIRHIEPGGPLSACARRRACRRPTRRPRPRRGGREADGPWRPRSVGGRA